MEEPLVAGTSKSGTLLTFLDQYWAIALNDGV